MVSNKAESSPKRPEGTRTAELAPDVILDFIFDDGLFFISIHNIGDKPAYKVSVKFDCRLLGVNGTKEISALPLFQNIEFLAPHKRIVAFLDQSSSYFARKEPTQISARVSFLDSEQRKYAVTIKHDLEIYREIGFVRPAKDIETSTMFSH